MERKGTLADMFGVVDMFNMADSLLNTNWEDVTCPICLEFPHRCVLLKCSYYEKGCRAFVCDTGHLLSNCLDRFRNAYGVSSPSISGNTSTTGSHSKTVEKGRKMACPLCRGEVTGWVVVDEARLHLDKKKRCCEGEKCAFSGTYLQLCEHALLKHPHSCPSKIDLARQLAWETFEQQYEMDNVLGTIFSENPQGAVMGDYVIEFDEDEDENVDMDEYEVEDVPGDGGNQ